MRIRNAVIFILGIFLLTGQGCYTQLRHQDVSEGGDNNVAITDNCYECHNSSISQNGILPKSAYHDYHWQFYANSAWWQDSSVSSAFQNTGNSESSGTLSGATTEGQTNRPETVVPSQPATVSSLSKKSNSNDNTSSHSQDTRRKIQRRKSISKSDKDRESSSRSARE